jgi:hypothetical protein
MTAMTAWMMPRLPMIRMIAVGSVTYPVAFLACWSLWPDTAAIAAPGDRLSLALQLAVAPAAVLFAMVMSLMRLFDTDRAEDPFAGAESHGFKINARVLQNSIEQAALFVPVLVGLSLRVAPERVKILPILTALWCVGRLLFWIGYRIKLEYRALGFDWTVYSTTIAFGWFAATLF